MNLKMAIFFLLTSTCLGLSQTRCFTYDAAGNRTSRFACAVAIAQNNNEYEIVSNLVSSVADDVGGDETIVRQQLLSNDISPLVIFPNPSSGVFHIDASFEKYARLTVYNSKGEAVFIRDNVPDQIDLMDMANGSYYMVISEPSGVRSAIIIISK